MTVVGGSYLNRQGQQKSAWMADGVNKGNISTRVTHTLPAPALVACSSAQIVKTPVVSEGRLALVERERAKLLQSCQTLCDPMNCIARQAPLSMGFPRREYWRGLPFPSPGDLPDPRIEPLSLLSPALAGGFFTTSATWETLALVSGVLKVRFLGTLGNV